MNIGQNCLREEVNFSAGSNGFLFFWFTDGIKELDCVFSSAKEITKNRTREIPVRRYWGYGSRNTCKSIVNHHWAWRESNFKAEISTKNGLELESVLSKVITIIFEDGSVPCEKDSNDKKLWSNRMNLWRKVSSKNQFVERCYVFCCWLSCLMVEGYRELVVSNGRRIDRRSTWNRWQIERMLRKSSPEFGIMVQDGCCVCCVRGIQQTKGLKSGVIFGSFGQMNESQTSDNIRETVMLSVNWILVVQLLNVEIWMLAWETNSSMTVIYGLRNGQKRLGQEWRKFVMLKQKFN